MYQLFLFTNSMNLSYKCFCPAKGIFQETLCQLLLRTTFLSSTWLLILRTLILLFGKTNGKKTIKLATPPKKYVKAIATKNHQACSSNRRSSSVLNSKSCQSAGTVPRDPCTPNKSVILWMGWVGWKRKLLFPISIGKDIFWNWIVFDGRFVFVHL